MSERDDPTAGLPSDLAALLRDPSTIVPADAAVFELIAKWADAPSNTASAMTVDEWRDAWVYSTRRWREVEAERDSLAAALAKAEERYDLELARAQKAEGEAFTAVAALTETKQALRAIRANAEAWHGPPEDEPRRAAALTVIARWARYPKTIPDGVIAALADVSGSEGESPGGV